MLIPLGCWEKNVKIYFCFNFLKTKQIVRASWTKIQASRYDADADHQLQYVHQRADGSGLAGKAVERTLNLPPSAPHVDKNSRAQSAQGGVDNQLEALLLKCAPGSHYIQEGFQACTVYNTHHSSTHGAVLWSHSIVTRLRLQLVKRKLQLQLKLQQ